MSSTSRARSASQTIEKTWTAIGANQVKKVEWARDAKVTSALCYVRVIFADGMAEEMELPVEYSFGAKLSVDLSRSSADIQAHTLTVNVSARVDTAEIIAYGAGKTVLEKREIPVNAGPGKITIPWAGDASEVVLLGRHRAQRRVLGGLHLLAVVLEHPP
jgi:hypothetical protein